MDDDVRYEDTSDGVLLALATEYAPLVERMAEIVVEEIQAQIDAGSPSGRRYYLPRSIEELEAEGRERRRARESGHGESQGRVRLTRSYTASAPGQPPAKPTLRYRNSWRVSKVSRRDDQLLCSAYTKARAANGESLGWILEYGTPKMAPRPHIRPALDRASKRIEALVGEAGEVES